MRDEFKMDKQFVESALGLKQSDTSSTQVVHYIRAWSGKRSDELPICGAALDATGPNRTLVPRTHYSDGRPMAICPNCTRLIAAAPAMLEVLEAIIESATDGREIPAWLEERLVDAKAAIRLAKRDSR